MIEHAERGQDGCVAHHVVPMIEDGRKRLLVLDERPHRAEHHRHPEQDRQAFVEARGAKPARMMTRDAFCSVRMAVRCWPRCDRDLELVMPCALARSRTCCSGDIRHTGSVLPAIMGLGLSRQLRILDLRPVHGDRVGHRRRLWRESAIPVRRTAARLPAAPLTPARYAERHDSADRRAGKPQGIGPVVAQLRYALRFPTVLSETLSACCSERARTVMSGHRSGLASSSRRPGRNL
jgi:hypothetical protein